MCLLIYGKHSIGLRHIYHHALMQVYNNRQ